MMLSLSSWDLLVQSRKWKHHNDVRNLLKVNNKDKNDASDVVTDFIHCFGFSIVDLGQVETDWVRRHETICLIFC